MIHKLKIWSKYFDDVVRDLKTFEIRKNDRDYKIGDTLVLNEWNPTKEIYTGRYVNVEVTYIIEDFLPEGYCAMSIVRIKDYV